LLDPCSPDIDPESRLRYDVRGEIHARPQDLQAQATIRICHLRRRPLRDDRARVVHGTLRLVRMLERRQARLGTGDPEVVELQQALNEIIRDDAEHAGAARYVVRDPDAF
jgi:hypothetical protein